MKSGRTLRIEVLQPAEIHWSIDYWRTTQDQRTRDTGLGVHVADLSTKNLSDGAMILFTIYWPDQNRWEGVNYDVGISKT